MAKIEKTVRYDEGVSSLRYANRKAKQRRVLQELALLRCAHAQQATDLAQCTIIIIIISKLPKLMLAVTTNITFYGSGLKDVF